MTASEDRQPLLGDEQALFDEFFGNPLDREPLADSSGERLSYRYHWPNERTELRALVDATGRVQALELVEGAPGPVDVDDPVGPVDEEAARNDAQAFLPAVDGGSVNLTLLPTPPSPAAPFPRTIWALQRA